MFTCGSILIFSAGFISSNGHPIDPKVILPASNGFGIAIFGGALLITTVIALIACTCCKQRRDGFKEFRNPTASGHMGFTNTLSELAIFPPPASAQQPQPPPGDAAPHVEAHPPSRPAPFSCVVPSVTDWFVDRNGNFPRQQLFYQKEIGKGWFGKVVKGEARGAKVVVRILREDATPEEKGYFLHEAKPFRDLKHKNISRLYGRCLEHDPFLLLFEYCANGDLKSFLVTNSGSRNAITEQKISLKMMIDVTEGLKFMNEHGFIHTDLAARNCLVASDLTVKIGDYGTSVDKYQNEYYIVGDVAVPIRWCAPETLTCTQTTIETKEVTEGGNVWSLAVLLWEIAEFGKLPYPDLTDDEVITRVLVQGSLRLPPPNCSFGHYLHNVMTLCWKMDNRANIEQILMMLMYLKNNPFQESDFESRWRALKPNTVVVVDNHTPIHSPRHTELAQRPHLTAKLEFDSGVDLEIKPTDENPDSCRTSTPNTVSPQLSVASEDIFQPVQHKSPSMTNLKGSLEDVAQFDSWLMGVEQKTEEDRKFVKNISEAIKNLDETLALEKTSSSSQDSSMEGSKKPLLDFKLGPVGNEKKGDSSSSDTEEETWRNRIERGEFTEKVKEKSKSVTDLMVLTHIDSEGSESDSLPSLTRQYSVKKTTVKGVSYTGIGFGSEGNIRNAVLSEELQDKLKQLTTWKTETQSFLVKGASEKNNKKSPFTAEKEDSKLISSMGAEDSPKPSSSSNAIITPTAADEQTVSCSKIISDVTTTAVSSSYQEENSIVNTKAEPVNKGSVMEEEKKDVNSECKKDSLINNELSVISKIRISESIGSNDSRHVVEDSKQSASSHSNKNSVPEIIITESEMPQVLDEPEPSVDTQYVVDVKPRKFVFICKNGDSLSDSSDDEGDVKAVEPQQESSCSVILGSCEEHTLDYFKGLKTTFTPTVSYVDDVNPDERCLKEVSNIVKNLPEVDQDVISLPEDISSKTTGEVKSDVKEQEKWDEDVSKNNGMTFGGFNKNFTHIIDSFIDNERAYTALLIVPDKDISPGVEKSLSVETGIEKNKLDHNSPKETGSSFSYGKSSEEISIETPIVEKKLTNQENLSSLQKMEDTFISEETPISSEVVEKKETNFLAENLNEKNLVETPIVENIFSKDVTNTSRIENPFDSGKSSEENLVDVSFNENLSSTHFDLDSPLKMESSSSSELLAKENLFDTPISTDVFSLHTNVAPINKTDNSFTFETSSKENTADQNNISNQIDLNSPLKMESALFSSEISTIENVDETPIDKDIFSKPKDLTSPGKIKNSFRSGSSEENILDKNTISKQTDLNSSFKMESTFSSDILTKKNLVESPIGIDIQPTDLTSLGTIENSFTSGASEENTADRITISKQTYQNSSFKSESPFSSESLTKENLVDPDIFTKSNVTSPSRIEDPFASGTFSEENVIHVTFNENTFSEKGDLNSPFKIGSSYSSENLVETPINTGTFSKSGDLTGPSKVEDPFVSGNLFSSVKVDLDSPFKMENHFAPENLTKNSFIETPISTDMFSGHPDLASTSKIEDPFASGIFSEENVVHVTFNENPFSDKVDLDSPFKTENSFPSEISNKVKENLIETPIDTNIFSEKATTSLGKTIDPHIPAVSSMEYSVEPTLNKNTFVEKVDLGSPFKMEIPVSSTGTSTEENLIETPVDFVRFSEKVELPSSCKNENNFSSRTSSEENLVDAKLNKKMVLDNLPKMEKESLVSLGNSSEELLANADKFSKKLELPSPCKIETAFSSEEQFVEAPFPFNQPDPTDIHSNIRSVKAKSLDSILSPKNGYEHFVTLRNGLYVEDDSHIANFVPVFNMTESVSENAFMSQNLYYDPYFSVDSGHSSDRCIEQDKKMNDLKNRLEDVVKSGSDFQLKNSEEEYGGKLLTPDDERSSDSGFRDKGSLSESVEDTCDEKYNLEDIDAELDEFTLKNIDKEDLKYYEQFVEPDRETTPGWFLHVRPESSSVDSKDSGWLSQSTEDEERLPLTIDAEFAAAIRNELKEKLPCAQQVEKTEEDASPEQEPTTDKFTYPSQLSPILEEQESNQSSLQLNDCSPVFILPPPEIKTDTFKEDIVKAFESLESSKNGIIMEDLEGGNGLVVFNDDRIVVDDDVLIVDTETNEATLIESPKPQSHLAFILTKKEPETFIDNDSPEVNSDIYILTPDNAPLTPNSVNTDSHSSPENANMSGLFLSPCSIRSDLFDSGPPSLPFDLGQSLEEVEDIPACEETLIENFIPGICNGDVDNEKRISNGNETELNDNKKIDISKAELKDSINKLIEPLKDHEENNKKSCVEVNLDQVSPADSNLKRSLPDEKVLKHLKAEVEIDRLLSRSNKENEIENTNHINSNSALRNDWLKDLFTNNINTTEINNKEDKNHVNTNLRKTDWPTIEELVYEKRSEKSEQNNCLKPNITSTLALMSPDLSSADSKSLASSFSSTPSSDENKTVAMSAETDSDSLRNSEKLIKPSSLSLKNDASGAPMPSPEDAEKGWRPTICQLMELTDQAAADGEEMTTSFIEPDENGIYTPDWESDISEEQSSSSGEFVWKEGDTEDLLKCVGTDTNSLNDDLLGGGMERIEEEDEDYSSCAGSDSGSEASSGGEFVPSTWNAMAVPTKSALKVNLSQKKNEHKRVVFKKEKYQCIYEYPREESDNEEEELSPAIWQTPVTPVFDYSVFADWELGEGEVISTPIDSVDSDGEDSKGCKKEEPGLEFYRLDYNPAPNLDRPWSDTLPEDDADFSPLAADLAPVRLGDLRHTKATLRLELPQLRPDQGEASILDPPP